jgi:hypothetical protein
MHWRYRLHEWLAERIPAIQFPNPRHAHLPLFRWAHPMSMGQRFTLVCLSLLLLIVALVLAGGLLFLFWAVIRS